MGKRGPRPTPKAILTARGSWRGKAGGPELQIDEQIPDCPDWLPKEAVPIWNEVCRILVPKGVLTAADANLLARYCDSMLRWKRAAAFIAKHGEFYNVKDAKGQTKCVMQWPQVSIYNNLAAQLTRYEQEMGLTPSARARLSVAAEPQKPAAAPHPNSLEGLRLAQ